MNVKNNVIIVLHLVILLPMALFGMEEYNQKLLQAVQNREIVLLDKLINNEMFDPQKEPHSLLMHEAVYAPPFVGKIKKIIKKYQNIENPEEKKDFFDTLLSEKSMIETISMLARRGISVNTRYLWKVVNRGSMTGTYKIDSLGQFVSLSSSWIPDIYYGKPICNQEFKNFYSDFYQNRARSIIKTLLECKADPNEELRNSGGVSYFFHIADGIQDSDVILDFFMHGFDLMNRKKDIDRYGSRFGKFSSMHYLVRERKMDICTKIFSILPDDKETKRIKTMFLVRKKIGKIQLCNIPKYIWHQIAEYAFGKKFLFLFNDKIPTINTLLKQPVGKKNRLLCTKAEMYGNKVLEPKNRPLKFLWLELERQSKILNHIAIFAIYKKFVTMLNVNNYI